MPVSKILWGPTFENELRLGFPLFDLVTDREEREGSEHVQSPSGAEDSWIVGRDYVIDSEVRWIPDGPGTNPVQTQLSGANSWQAFLDYARDANALRFIPDETAPDFYIDNVYLVEPRKGFGNLSGDIKRNVRIKLRNATMDFHQALRGVMLQIQAGMSLTDPTVVTFARADSTTCATRIKRDGTIETVAADVLRIEWVDLDGDGVRETPGFLLEGSRQNLCLQSETFGTTWVPTRSSVSTNADTAPDGALTADRLVEDATASNTHPILQSVTTTSGANCAVSVFAKAGTRSWIVLSFEESANGANRARCFFNLATGAKGTASAGGTAAIVESGIEKLGNGWYRCHVAGSIPGVTATSIRIGLATGDGGDSYSGDGASYVSLWGGQVENSAAFCSSYIKTVASAVTRAADSFTLPCNFGPMDLTVLQRIARPVWADASGDLGFTPGAYQLSPGVVPNIRGGGSQTTRNYFAFIDGASADSTSSNALLAGNPLTISQQFKNLTTGGQAAEDLGAGLSAFASAASAFTVFGNQTLRVGALGAGVELYGVLLDLKVASKLRTLSEMLSL